MKKLSEWLTTAGVIIIAGVIVGSIVLLIGLIIYKLLLTLQLLGFVMAALFSGLMLLIAGQVISFFVDINDPEESKKL